MAKIGSFSVVKKTIAAAAEDPADPKYDTFDFEGEEFRVIAGMPGGLPLLEFADAMAAADDEDGITMEALAAIYQMLKSCILPADYARFRKLALKSGASPEDIVAISQGVWAAVMSRPSGGPSASPDGPSTISISSKGGSPSITGQPSTSTDGPPDRQPSPPQLAVVGGDWWDTPPPNRPDLAAPMVSVEDYATGRVAV